MKKLLLIAIVVFIGIQSFGQTSSASEEELVKSYFKLSKKALFEANMKMSDVQATAFWPLYNKFETEAGKLQDDRITFLKEYAENFENITEEQADEFIKKVFQYRKKMLALKMKYYKQVKKATNSLVATRFLEIEQYVQTAVMYEILESLPFVGDNDM
jgi:16S rRNA A1518/A1519 N6-dimethyltransferase RsmA/KsgA/DIM1 with predicted DNA glycosylase/AP lyase activity